MEILLLCLAAVLAGQQSYLAISDWIQHLSSEDRERFGCRRCGSNFKVPSESTIRRTLQRLDADGLDGILNEWLAKKAS